jgi:hypothetical protein
MASAHTKTRLLIVVGEGALRKKSAKGGRGQLKKERKNCFPILNALDGLLADGSFEKMLDS